MFVAIAAVLALLHRRPAVLALVLVADGAADLLATGIKEATRRHRPFVHQLGPSASTYSFPSGHSATAFACATVLAASAPRLRIPLFALAVLIALSRLYNGDHYPTDVLAGASLGAGIAACLLLVRRRRGERTG